MNPILRHLFRKYIEPEREAYFLVGLASQWGFVLFKNKDFRHKINFDKLEKIEQDRIFNELIVTSLVYLIVMIDDKLKQDQISDQRWEFWRDVRDAVPYMHSIMISKFKVPQQYVEMWDELLEMRLEEFYKRRQEAYQIWDERPPAIEALEDEQKEDLRKQTLISIETLRITVMMYLTKDEAEPDHPLKNVLKTWLSWFHNKLMKRVGW